MDPCHRCSTTTSVAPASTDWPSATATSRTRPVPGRAQLVLHLHGLDHHQALAGLDRRRPASRARAPPCPASAPARAAAPDPRAAPAPRRPAGRPACRTWTAQASGRPRARRTRPPRGAWPRPRPRCGSAPRPRADRASTDRPASTRCASTTCVRPSTVTCRCPPCALHRDGRSRGRRSQSRRSSQRIHAPGVGRHRLRAPAAGRACAAGLRELVRRPRRSCRQPLVVAPSTGLQVGRRASPSLRSMNVVSKRPAWKSGSPQQPAEERDRRA